MKTAIRVGGVPEHFNFPWRLALDKALFNTHGIAVDYVDYPGGTGAMAEALARGDLDVALMLTEGAVLDILEGSGNRLVKVYVESPLTWGIHVAAGSDITSADAIGQRPVAISRHGSGSHLIAIVDAIERGFTADEMRFVVVGDLDGARHALANGQADVFLWEKHMTQPLVDSGEFRRVDERRVPWPAFVASATPAALRLHAGAIRTALDVVAGCAAELKASPDAATRIAAAYEISEQDASDWLETVAWSQSYEPPAAALGRVVAALAAQGSIDTAPSSLDGLWHRL